MAVELAAAYFVHLAGGDPFPLVVGVVEPPVGSELHAVGAAEAESPGNHPALGSHFHAPAAVSRPGLMPATKGQVEREKEIALGVAGRAEAVLVIVAREAELVAHGGEAVGAFVPVGVFYQRQLGALGHVEPPGRNQAQAQHFVQAGGPAAPAHLVGVFGRGIFHQPDIAATGGHVQFAVGPEDQPSAFDQLALGQRERLHQVVPGFAFGGWEVPVQTPLELDHQPLRQLGPVVKAPFAADVANLN